MTGKTLLTDEEIKTLAREAGCPVVTDRDGIMTFQAYGEDLRKFVILVAERAAAAEREAMKPAIIKALQDNEREGHSYFLGANPGVSKDDYDDVAEEAIAIRARGEG